MHPSSRRPIGCAPRRGTGEAVRIFVLTVAAFAASGCHAMWSANIHHNSRGTACVSSPLPALIDVGLTAAAVASLTVADGSDEYAGAGIVAGLFGLSALWGFIEVARCQSDDDHSDDDRHLLRPQPRRQINDPSRTETPAKPTDADPIPRRPNPLRVPEDFLDRADKPGPPTPITCSLETSSKCPADQICVVKEGAEGTCEPVDPPKR